MPPAVPAPWSWRIRLLFGWLLVWASAAHAAFEVTGGGARSTGLGGAFGAGADALDAVWTNPAANARGGRWQGGTTHVLLYPGVAGSPSLNALSLVAPVGGGGLIAGFSALGADDWDEQVGLVGYGRALHPRVAVGGDVRTGAWRTTGWSHRAWSADLGAVYEVGWVHTRHFLRLGLVMRDLVRTSQAAGGQSAARAPRALVLGASLNGEAQQVLVDLEHRAGRLQLRVGYESLLPNTAGMRLRFGGSAFASDWQGGELSAGVGHRWREWSFDFSYTYPLGPDGAFGGVHRLSLGYRRGP